MTLVVDASVALKWLVVEPGSPEADALSDVDRLIAPELLLVEVANAIWKRERGGHVVPAAVPLAPSAVSRVLDDLVPVHVLADRALQIARSLDHPAYDCFYLALAEREDAILVTADARLAKRVVGTAWDGRVRTLASFAGSAR